MPQHSPPAGRDHQARSDWLDMEESDALKQRWVGVGEIPDGHRWDSPPKIRFARDSPLEGGDSV